MALFMIERQFADRLQLSSDAVRQIVDVNQEIGVNWLMSFLSADQKKTYCLYEARAAGRRDRRGVEDRAGHVRLTVGAPSSLRRHPQY
jgi:Protein of unknown function (DUF4242)